MDDNVAARYKTMRESLEKMDGWQELWHDFLSYRHWIIIHELRYRCDCDMCQRAEKMWHDAVLENVQRTRAGFVRRD